MTADDAERSALPRLNTPRLLLRAPEPADVPALLRIAGDADVARNVAAIPHPYRVADALRFLDEIARGHPVWAITFAAERELIGVVSLTNREATDPRHAVLGYFLRKDLWGRGIATEAAAAAIAFCAARLGLQRLSASYFAANPASGRVLEKLGFVEVGTGEDPCLAEGGTKPAILCRWNGFGPS